MSSRASEIRIVPLGPVNRDLLDYLALTLAERFSRTCVETQVKVDIERSYSSTRRQYHSTALLAQLREHSGDESKLLGVTDVDLFIPIFTFVFGEAQVGGNAALLSTHRLHQEFYGLPADMSLLVARADKEAVHELGHAYALTHCRSFDCVMHFSNSVEQVDLRPCQFCQLCEDRLHDRSGFNLAA